VQDGRTLTPDGPCVAVTEALSGYLYFEADDLDAAIEPGGADSAARMGDAVEVRPVVEQILEPVFGDAWDPIRHEPERPPRRLEFAEEA
jgi:hypothetical protein